MARSEIADVPSTRLCERVRRFAAAAGLILAAAAPAPGAPDDSARGPQTTAVELRTDRPSPIPGCGDVVPGAESADVPILLDDSGSAFGAHGTDPDLDRYRAAAFAARFLIATDRGRCHRVAVVRFGGSAPPSRTLPLTPVRALGRSLRRALRPGAPLGPTRYWPAFDRARELLGPVIPGRHRVVLCITDGTPHDPLLTREQQLVRDRAAVRALGDVALHVVVVDRAGTFDRADASYWKRVGADSIDLIPRPETGALQRLFARLLTRDLGLTASAETTLRPDRDLRFDVAPLGESLVVSSTSADPAAVTDVLRPDGSRAARLRGAAAVAQVARPAGGSWRLRVTGGKAAHVAVAVRPLSLVQRAPATATWPQGRELRPEAWAPTAWSAARAGGAVTLTATLRDARGRETSRPLLPAAAGLFVARRGLVTDVAGASSIQLALRRDGRVLARTRPAPLQIVPVPYFVIANDDVPSRRSLRVPMLLMLRGRPVDARRALADDPAGIATASAVAAGRNLDDVRVRWRGGARFEVVSADELRDDERVRLTVHLGARDRRGGEVVNAATASIRARRTTGAAWADRLHTGVRIVLGVVLVALCAYCLWLLTRPRMTGRVQMGGVRITVHGRFPVACRDGGARCWLFGVRGQGVVVRRGLLPLPWGTRPAPLSSRQFSSSRPGRTNPTRRS